MAKFGTGKSTKVTMLLILGLQTHCGCNTGLHMLRNGVIRNNCLINKMADYVGNGRYKLHDYWCYKCKHVNH